MARSNYIYLVENQFNEILGTFTVKHEAIQAIEDFAENRPLVYYRIVRRRDGIITGTTYDQNWVVYERGEHA